jgi:aminotransferase
LSCSSLSKTYSITGWRLGYIIASKNVIEGARKVHDFLTVGAAAPLQEAALAALDFSDEYYEKLQVDYTERKNYFLTGLDKLNLKYSNPQGAYYVLVDISEFGAESDTEFCEWMAREVGVAAVPGSSFFKEDIKTYIRFHFAKSIETLSEALKRLEQLHVRAKKQYQNL